MFTIHRLIVPYFMNCVACCQNSIIIFNWIYSSPLQRLLRQSQRQHQPLRWMASLITGEFVFHRFFEEHRFRAIFRAPSPIPIFTLINSFVPMLSGLLTQCPCARPDEPFFLILSFPVSMSRSSWITIRPSEVTLNFLRTHLYDSAAQVHKVKGSMSRTSCPATRPLPAIYASFPVRL